MDRGNLLRDSDVASSNHPAYSPNPCVRLVCLFHMSLLSAYSPGLLPLFDYPSPHQKVMINLATRINKASAKHSITFMPTDELEAAEAAMRSGTRTSVVTYILFMMKGYIPKLTDPNKKAESIESVKKFIEANPTTDVGDDIRKVIALLHPPPAEGVRAATPEVRTSSSPRQTSPWLLICV